MRTGEKTLHMALTAMRVCLIMDAILTAALCKAPEKKYFVYVKPFQTVKKMIK